MAHAILPDSREEIIADTRQKMTMEMQRKMAAFKAKALEEAQAEASEMLDAFDEELVSLKDQVDQEKRKNEKLKEQIETMKTSPQVQKSNVALMKGTEEEFDENEISDLVQNALLQTLKSVPPGSRRADLITDLLKHNTYSGISEKKEERIKNDLRDYKHMNVKLQKELTDLGFDIQEDHKHYHLIYHGDNRYRFILAKTPSDFRSGRNVAAEICKKALVSG